MTAVREAVRHHAQLDSSSGRDAAPSVANDGSFVRDPVRIAALFLAQQAECDGGRLPGQGAVLPGHNCGESCSLAIEAGRRDHRPVGPLVP